MIKRKKRRYAQQYREWKRIKHRKIWSSEWEKNNFRFRRYLDSSCINNRNRNNNKIGQIELKVLLKSNLTLSQSLSLSFCSDRSMLVWYLFLNWTLLLLLLRFFAQKLNLNIVFLTVSFLFVISKKCSFLLSWNSTREQTQRSFILSNRANSVCWAAVCVWCAFGWFLINLNDGCNASVHVKKFGRTVRKII